MVLHGRIRIAWCSGRDRMAKLWPLPGCRLQRGGHGWGRFAKMCQKIFCYFHNIFWTVCKAKSAENTPFLPDSNQAPRIEASALTPVRSLRLKKGNAIGERSAREKAVCRRTRNRIQIRSAFSFRGAFLLLFLSSKFQFRLHIRLYLFVSVDAR